MKKHYEQRKPNMRDEFHQDLFAIVEAQNQAEDKGPSLGCPLLRQSIFVMLLFRSSVPLLANVPDKPEAVRCAQTHFTQGDCLCGERCYWFG